MVTKHSTPVADPSAAALKTIMDAVPVAMMAFGGDERRYHANAPAVRLFGVALDGPAQRCGDIVGCAHRLESARGCGFSPDCPACPLTAAIRAALAEALESAADGTGRQESPARQGEASLVRDTGLPSLKVCFTVSPLSLGERPFALMVVTDVTAARQAENLSKETEVWYRSIYENAGDGILLTVPDGTILDANPAACRMLGRSVAEIRRAGRSGIVDTGDPRLAAALEDRRRHGFVHTELTLIRADGTRFPADFTSSVFTDADGRQRTSMIFRDMTERREAEAALSAQRTFLESLLTTIPGPVFYKDRTGSYLGCNPAFEDLTGRPMRDIIGKTAVDLTTADLARDDAARDEALYAAGGRQVCESRVRRSDGAFRDVVFHKAVFADPEGRPGGLIGVILDITELRDSERRFRRAQRLESIGTLAGGIAHDFNNILSAVIGFAELAVMAAGDDALLRDHLEEVLKAGRRAKHLVGQILAFSRQTEVTIAPVQLHPIVGEALKLLRATLPATIHIEKQIDTHAPVMADPTQIHQVLMNLCTNAYQAMRETGGVLRVAMEEAWVGPADPCPPEGLAPGHYLRLIVSDTGPGIPAHLIEHIFDPYFTTKAEGEGTGLGLSVVHGIVTAHGGAVTVESQPGAGTTFTVYLPLAPDPETEVADGSAGNAVAGGSERILVVDDEVSIRKILSGMLTSLGYSVTVTQSAREALARFREAPSAFDLVLTDMTMPGMPGDVMAQEMLRIRPDLPIVICTGFSERIDEEKAHAIGIRALVMKPFELALLAAELRRVLDTRHDR